MLTALLIGIAVNLDNFIIGINLGVRSQKLTLASNTIIALTTGICAFASTYAAMLISGNFLVYTNIIGSIIMVVFGVYCLIKSAVKQQEETLPDFSSLAPKDTCVLGFVLAINCIPPSFSAGIMSLSPYYVGFFSALFSFLCMFISNRLGYHLIRYRFIRLLIPGSAILLIFIGVFELFV